MDIHSTNTHPLSSLITFFAQSWYNITNFTYNDIVQNEARLDIMQSYSAIQKNSVVKQELGISGYTHVLIDGQLFAHKNTYLHRGGNGSVHIAYKIDSKGCVQDDKVYLIKKISKLKAFNSEELEKEARLMQQLDRFVRIDSSNKLVAYLVMDLEQGTPLNSIENQKAIHEMAPDEKLATALLLVNAYDELHQHYIVHGDVTPGNILLHIDVKKQKKSIRIIDFGTSYELKKSDQFLSLDKTVGTPKYLAPEMRDKKQLGFPSDIFSLGLVLSEEIFHDMKDIDEPFNAYLSQFFLKMQHNDPLLRPKLNEVISFLTIIKSSLINREYKKSPEIIYLALEKILSPVEIVPKTPSPITTSPNISLTPSSSISPSSIPSSPAPALTQSSIDNDEKDKDDGHTQEIISMPEKTQVLSDLFAKRDVHFDKKEEEKLIGESKITTHKTFDFESDSSSDDEIEETDDENRLKIIRKKLIGDTIKCFEQIQSEDMKQHLSRLDEDYQVSPLNYPTIERNWQRFHKKIHQIHANLLKLKKIKSKDYAAKKWKKIDILSTNEDTVIVATDSKHIYEINLKKMIGEGGFGKVYEAHPVKYNDILKRYEKIAGEKFVAKIMKPEAFDSKEYDVLSSIKIKTEEPRYIHLPKQDPNIILIMEHLGDPIDKENLKILKQKPYYERIHLLLTIVKKINLLHALDILHCDLKGLNILFRYHDDLPVGTPIDYGSLQFSSRKDKLISSASASEYTTLPKEFALLLKRNKSSDYYALVGLFLEILGASNPYTYKKEFKKSLQECKSIMQFQQALAKVKMQYINDDFNPILTRKNKIQLETAMAEVKNELTDKQLWQEDRYKQPFNTLINLISCSNPNDKLKTLTLIQQFENEITVDTQLRLHQWRAPFDMNGLCEDDEIVSLIKPYLEQFLLRMAHIEYSKRPKDQEIDAFFTNLFGFYQAKKEEKPIADTHQLNLALLATGIWMIPVIEQRVVTPHSLSTVKSIISPMAKKLLGLKDSIKKLKLLYQKSPLDDHTVDELCFHLEQSYHNLAGDFATYRRELRIQDIGRKNKSHVVLGDSKILTTVTPVNKIRNVLLKMEQSGLFLYTENSALLHKIIKAMIKGNILIAKHILSIEHLSIDVLKKCEDLIYSEYESKSNEKPLSIKIPKNHISVQTLPSASSVEPDKVYSAIYSSHRLHRNIHTRSTIHKKTDSNLENEYSFRK